MTDAAAFQATFAGLRSLADGDYRVSFDFPGEKLQQVVEVLAQGGKPSAAQGTWFAIARLNLGVSGTEKLSSNLQNDNGNGAARNPLTQRAALLCNDPQFRLFLEKKFRGTMIPANCAVNTEKEAAMVVRSFCRVESRAHIVPGSEAADRWENLNSQFIVWKNAARYVEEAP